MNRVAVSQRVEHSPERGERRDALDQRMTAFLSGAGVAAVPVPNGLVALSRGDQALGAWMAACAPQGLVLTGGEDWGVHPERDATETALLAYAKAERLPVLGICRGMQVMAAHAGARLAPVQGHRGGRHAIDGVLRGEVNSFHAFAVAACPDGFEVLARSSDGVIEAILSSTRPWEGWMWHPEREAEFPIRDLNRARRLFSGVGS